MQARSSILRLGSIGFALLCAFSGCKDPETPTDENTAKPNTSGTAKAPPANPEPHLADLRQLTFGGENAEAYWANSGKELILQAKIKDMGCDQIFRINVADPQPNYRPVSNGKGATTCSYFLPGDQDVIYASTHLGGDACPPKPDHSKGYVWALYDTYDIFRAKADGSGTVRLTDTKGYDAEGTVCKKDGSIVFTSVRDGDIDLYRMDADGKNVKRLTTEPGYDGGAFFNDDCTKIVWRASRPKGKDLEDFRGLLAQGLVRPTKLELYVANADGSDPVQVTYLNAASFGPYFTPDSKRILFSSNVGDPKGREFDIWAIDVDGTRLERITSAPGFDGFPIFSPDGKTLAFSSNRATEQGKQDTNVFVAKWVDGTIVSEPSAADRVAEDVRWLADPKREGRGVGSAGLEAAGKYIEERFKALKLEPAGKDGGFRQAFELPVSLSGDAKLTVAGEAIKDVTPLSFSKTTGSISGTLVFANYGVEMDGYSDYKGLDVKDKIVVVRRFVPDEPAFSKVAAQRKHGDLRRKAWVAREKGAKAIVVVDYPAAPKGNKGWKMPDEAKIPSLDAEMTSDAQIPALIASRASLSGVVDKLAKRQALEATLEVTLKPESKPVFNVVGRIASKSPDKSKGVILIGAHYDHLGMGGHGSLAPSEKAVHPGADDNASGTAAILEVARALSQPDVKLDRDVVFVAFSGEERGILGSNYFTKNPLPGLAPTDIAVMINLDMVGRIRGNTLEVGGYDTATELAPLAHAGCDATRVNCNLTSGGWGPSDHAAFYGANVPVLFLFSGTHGDYHKPSDTAEKLSYGGIAQAALLTEKLAREIAGYRGKLTYVSTPAPPPKGDQRSFGASLGTIPDYAGSGGGKGVLLQGVRPGGAADKAGIQKGDLLVKIGKHDITSVEDLMYVLNESKPGQKAKAVVMRGGKKVEVEVTFQESKR